METYKSLEQLPKETERAYAAFLDYVGLGAGRSLAKLMEVYQTQPANRPTKQISMLKTWSSKHEWQRRVKEFQLERTMQGQSFSRESYNEQVERAMPLGGRIIEQLETMLADFQRLRVTRRTMVPDPRDPTGERQIESIQSKVNVRDLEQLARTFDTLGKSLRLWAGLPAVTEIQGGVDVHLKTYIAVSPEDWDNEPAPEIEPRQPFENEDTE